jgi:hemoglobin-like flavoprotein
MDTDFDFVTAANRFYEVLFDKAPSVEKYFGDIKSQNFMFMNALESIHDLRGDDSQLDNFLKMLGRYHGKFGLTKEHFDVGAVAFEQAVLAGGANMDDEQKQFYLDAFSTISEVMGAAIEEQR